MKTIANQAYRLKLLAKKRIYPVFYILFLDRNVIKKKTVDQKIANQFKFEERKQPK